LCGKFAFSRVFNSQISNFSEQGTLCPLTMSSSLIDGNTKIDGL
jgi:hypothetical protein